MRAFILPARLRGERAAQLARLEREAAAGRELAVAIPTTYAPSRRLAAPVPDPARLDRGDQPR